MKRSYTKTTASVVLAASLILLQVVLPLQASADAYTTPVLNYTNPNQFTNGSNPYAFKASDVLNPQLLTSVIGCTGIVNEVAQVSSGFIKKLITRKAAQVATTAKITTTNTTQAATTSTANSTAAATSAGIKAGAAIVAVTPSGIVTSDAGEKLIGVADLTTTATNSLAQSLKDGAAIMAKNQNILAPTNAIVGAVNSAQDSIDAASFREECINGIAIQLAKNELVSFTRDTMNWVTTGFGGSPYYPRDTDSFLNSLTNYYTQKEANFFETIPDADAGKYPWGKDYARAQVNGLRSVQDYYNTLTSDMSNYLYNGYTIQNFSTDFSTGGWNGWLAMTQHPQNNPLGFDMLASQNLANTQSRAVNLTQQQLQQNGGIFDQRKCVAWSKPGTSTSGQTNGMTTTVTNPTQTAGSTCTQYETVSPGSVILSKINTYVNSPELQLTLVKTMNDALNALFSSLLGKFENQGLSSLGTNVSLTTGDGSQGFASNELFDSSGNLIPLAGGENSGSGSGSDGSFDITKDLGNTYVQPVNDGTWDASTNTPQLLPGVGTTGHYYTVSVSGSTDLTGNGDYWAKGDKAFFDGTSWSNGVPPYIISHRGVLQNQQDYVDTTKQYLSVVGNILPALGKLDYCIPGPNPSWQDTATTAEQTLLSQQTTPEEMGYWGNVASNLMTEYSQRIDALYGTSSPMQTATLPDGSNNPSYLPMSADGLSLTSNISGYADSVSQAQTDSQSILTQSSSDIAKLNAIKDQVNVIIAAAQKRRAAERVQNGLPAFKQVCLDAEKVTYIVNGQKK
jgi:hypothetical protein